MLVLPLCAVWELAGGLQLLLAPALVADLCLGLLLWLYEERKFNKLRLKLLEL